MIKGDKIDMSWNTNLRRCLEFTVTETIFKISLLSLQYLNTMLDL